MCFKVNEQCPRCGVRTGVVYYHKQLNCPNNPMTCLANVEKDLRATGSRFLDLRCKTPGCLFSHAERERIEAQYHGLGPRVIIVTLNGTIRLDEEFADFEVIKAASDLPVAAKEEDSNASLPGLRPDGKPAAKSESVGPVEMPMHQHPGYQIVIDNEYDEQGRPIRRPLGRTRLPNGRMPLPSSRPPLASLGIRDSGLSSRETATSGRFAPSGPNPQRNNTKAAANAGTVDAGRERLAPIPRFTASPTAAVPTAQSKGKAKATNEPANNSETESATDSPTGNTHTPRQGWSGRRLPEIPGRNGMTAVLVHRATPDRPPKWQYRSVGRLRLEDLPPQQAQQIRELKARMDDRVNWQTSVPGMGGGSIRGPGGGAQGPRYVLEEDQLLQLLRLSGFGYEQIQREFIPRRSQDSLTVRRKGHKRGIHVRGFQYIPDNGFMNAEESSGSDQAPGQQEGGSSVEPAQQNGTGEDETIPMTGEQQTTGQEQNGSKDIKSESKAQEGDRSNDANDANDEHEANDADDEHEADDAKDAHGGDGAHDEHEADNGNDADDEHEANEGDEDSDERDTEDRQTIPDFPLSESGSSESSESEEDDVSDDVSDASDTDNEEDSDFDDDEDSDFDMEDPTYDTDAMIQSNADNGDTPLLDIIREQEAPLEEQVPAPPAATSAVNTESTTTAVDTSPRSNLKRKRDVYDPEDSDDEAPSKAMKVDEE